MHSEDTLATLDCFKRLGVRGKLNKDGSLDIQGVGLYFNKKNKVVLYAGESGTTIRILAGALCGQKFPIELKAAPALSKRPMARVINPLRIMGADISAKNREGKLYPPIKINPVRKILSADVKIDVASAQVKSAIMMAGLYADGKVSLREPFKSRDHTERMLPLFGVPVKVKGNTVTVTPKAFLRQPKNVFVPGDFSSAAFFIVLGLIAKDSCLKIKNVNINPTRIGLLNVLKRMGADIKIINKQNSYEPYADIEVRSSVLNGTMVQPKEIPLMVDEVPVLCVAAAFAKGMTEIQGIEELRVKETDRVNSMISNLRASGVDISDNRSGLVINGGGGYNPADFRSFGDHRTAMSMIVFSMALDRPGKIDDISCISKSFPDFIKMIASL